LKEPPSHEATQAAQLPVAREGEAPAEPEASESHALFFAGTRLGGSLALPVIRNPNI